MHAGGSFLHSAFYGGRIAGAMTFGAAFKLIRGATHVGKGISGKIKASKDKKGNDESDKFSEDKGSQSSDTSGEQSDGGGSE